MQQLGNRVLVPCHCLFLLDLALETLDRSIDKVGWHSELLRYLAGLGELKVLPDHFLLLAQFLQLALGQLVDDIKRLELVGLTGIPAKEGAALLNLGGTLQRFIHPQFRGHSLLGRLVQTLEQR
jgi:hypothetical protein